VSDPTPTGVLVMAYGTASGPDDIERYYTDIRGGRAPSPEHLHELRERYAAIGNVFPLLDITRAQAEGIVERLNGDGDGRTWRAYLGMKHSPPSVAEAVAAMAADGVERAVGIVMAPHWSGMSVETYLERAQQAVEEGGHAIELSFVRSFHDHPMLVDFLAEGLRGTLAGLTDQERAGVTVLFTAHSLPVREAPDGTLRCKTCDCEGSCRYRDGLVRTGDLVAAAVGGPGGLDHRIAWQSVGRTADPWFGPGIDEMLPVLAAEGRSACVVCCAGFVADHLETLYDLDIEARRQAAEAGIGFARTPMPNADPAFLDVLAQVVRDHLAQAGP